MDRDLAKPRAVLVQRQFFATWFAVQRVIDIAGFLAYEENGFFLLFALRHRRYPSSQILRGLNEPQIMRFGRHFA
jgi:hypothetical protein